MAETLKWLVWDGVYSTAGSCSKNAPGSATAAPLISAPITVRLMPSSGSGASTTALSATHARRPLGMELLYVDPGFFPVREWLAIRIGLDRMDLVKAMLMRVFDRNGAVVYQEFLDAKEVKKLPSATHTDEDPTLMAGQKKAFSQECDRDEIEGRAHPLLSPYKVEVWVSTDSGAFAKCKAKKASVWIEPANVVQPQEKVGKTLRAQTTPEPSSSAPLGKLDSVNDARPHHTKARLPALRVAMFTPSTYDQVSLIKGAKPTLNPLRVLHSIDANAPTTALMDPAMTASLLRQRFKEIRDILNAEVAYQNDPPDTLRLFLTPEWYFGHAANNPYAPAEMEKVLQMMLDASVDFPRTLMACGSINWALPTKEGRKIAYNTVPIVREGRIIHIYHKQREGGEVAKGTGTIWGWGTTDHDDRTGTGAEAPENLRINTAALQNTCLFTHAGLSFAVEVCADHCNSVALHEYEKKYSPQTDGRKYPALGVDVHLQVSCGSAASRNGTLARAQGYHVHSEGAITVPDVFPKSSNVYQLKPDRPVIGLEVDRAQFELWDGAKVDRRGDNWVNRIAIYKPLLKWEP